MNKTTKADRDRWIARAKNLIKMDNELRGLNGPQVVDQLMREFGISKDSARTATAHAFMQTRAVFVRK